MGGAHSYFKILTIKLYHLILKRPLLPFYHTSLLVWRTRHTIICTKFAAQDAQTRHKPLKELYMTYIRPKSLLWTHHILLRRVFRSCILLTRPWFCYYDIIFTTGLILLLLWSLMCKSLSLSSTILLTGNFEKEP